MRDGHDDLQARGIRILAVTPDEPGDSRLLAADLGLAFPLLSDRDGRVAAAAGAAAGGELRPAAVLVDQQGRVRWSHIGTDPADQPTLRQVLAATAPDRLPVPGPSHILTPVMAALVAVAFLLLAGLAAAADGELLAWDVPVRDALRGTGEGWLGALMAHSSRLGSRGLIAGLSVPMVALAWRRCRQLAVVLVLAFPAALGLELVLKAMVDRPRPPMATGFGASFPSGHVLAAAAFWGLVPPWVYVVVRRRWAWAVATVGAVAIVAAVGVSRVHLGAHWPSDVVGGYLGSAVFLLAAEWAVRRPSRVLHCDACELHPLRSPPAPRP